MNEAYQFLANFLKDRSGHFLTEGKEYLVESRLLPVAKSHGMSSVLQLIDALKLRPSPQLISDVVDSMATHETLFFRDQKPFDIFQATILPYWAKTRASTKRVRIWCAACSAGQEPYSLALILKEAEHQFPGWNFEIVGTDISQCVINQAKEALYTQFEVQRGLPIRLLLKYFKQVGSNWSLNPEIKNMVKFSVFNLLDDPSRLGTFDLIFCRNVLIYFDVPTKSKAIEYLHKALSSDGVLCLGSSESMLGVSTKFAPYDQHRGFFVSSTAPQRVAV